MRPNILRKGEIIIIIITIIIIIRVTLSLFRELPYFRLNVNLAHGQFNTCLPSHLPAKKYLEKLSSIYDLNLFRLNALEDPNPVDNLYNHRIHSRYYSPYKNLKVKFPVVSVIRDSLFDIVISGVLSEILKTFKFIYWTS